MGAIGKYKKEYDEQSYRLTLLGFTDKDLADFFYVTEQTINNWKKDHPTFFESLTRGKANADGIVAESFYKSATGYYIEEEEAKVVGVGRGESVVQIVKIKRYVQPDKGSQLSWLKNRQKNLWRDKQEIETTPSNLTVTISGPTPPNE
jgi:hypothetical protein